MRGFECFMDGRVCDRVSDIKRTFHWPRQFLTLNLNFFAYSRRGRNAVSCISSAGPLIHNSIDILSDRLLTDAVLRRLPLRGTTGEVILLRVGMKLGAASINPPEEKKKKNLSPLF